MDSTKAPRVGSRYATINKGEAERRTRVVMAEVGLDTDVALDDRLTGVLMRWMTEEAAARDLANQTRHLYQLLTRAGRTEPNKPVEPDSLRRALHLAMTRPDDDPCWRDYQALLAVIEQHHREVQAAYHAGPLLRIRRAINGWKPDKIEDEARARPLIEARKQFAATWRA